MCYHKGKKVIFSTKPKNRQPAEHGVHFDVAAINASIRGARRNGATTTIQRFYALESSHSL